MSLFGIASALPPLHGPLPQGATFPSDGGSWAHDLPAKLLDWIRLPFRHGLGSAEIGADLSPARPVSPYRPCERCAREARWCPEGALAAEPRWSGGALAAALAAMGSARQLAVGLQADPYPAAEKVHGGTRRLLQLLADGSLDHAFDLSIHTRSALLLRDLDLLVELDQRHTVTVGVLLPAVDPWLGLRVESHASPHPATSPAAARHARRSAPFAAGELPAALAARPGADAASGGAEPAPIGDYGRRLDMVRTLAAEGIATQVICSPVLAGWNNATTPLRRLFALAREAGATDVLAAPRHPALPPTRTESAGLLALFDRLRLEQGFPCIRPGRG
jgi:hypothetical protein